MTNGCTDALCRGHSEHNKDGITLCYICLKTARGGGAAECVGTQKLVHGSTAFSHWFKYMCSERSELPQSLSQLSQLPTCT